MASNEREEDRRDWLVPFHYEMTTHIDAMEETDELHARLDAAVIRVLRAHKIPGMVGSHSWKEPVQRDVEVIQPVGDIL